VKKRERKNKIIRVNKFILQNKNKKAGNSEFHLIMINGK
jgi:hypothetical protein